MLAKRATTEADPTYMQGEADHCKRELCAAAMTQPVGSESQTHPTGTASGWHAPAVLGSASFQSAA
jgi:hypothetical protein